MKFFYALTGCCTFLILLLDSDASLTAQDKVGINTTSPKETVHVMGGLLVEGGLLVGTSDTLHTYVMNSEAESTDTSGVLYDTGGPTGNYGNNGGILILDSSQCCFFCATVSGQYGHRSAL